MLFILPKIWEENGDNTLIIWESSQWCSLVRLKHKTQTTSLITPFHSTLSQFLRCAWACFYLYLLFPFTLFFGLRVGAHFKICGFWSSLDFILFMQISLELCPSLGYWFIYCCLVDLILIHAVLSKTAFAPNIYTVALFWHFFQASGRIFLLCLSV